MAVVPQRVLVIGMDQLLSEGIVSLLSQAANLRLFCCVSMDENQVIAEIWRVKPSVLVLVNDIVEISPTNLLEKLKSYPGIRLIVVSGKNNHVQVFDSQSIVLNSPIELAHLIQFGSIKGLQPKLPTNN